MIIEPEDVERLSDQPQAEVLALLDALVNRYGLTVKRGLQPLTESDRHRLALGHPLKRGCCSPKTRATHGGRIANPA